MRLRLIQAPKARKELKLIKGRGGCHLTFRSSDGECLNKNVGCLMPDMSLRLRKKIHVSSASLIIGTVCEPYV